MFIGCCMCRTQSYIQKRKKIHNYYYAGNFKAFCCHYGCLFVYMVTLPDAEFSLKFSDRKVGFGCESYVINSHWHHQESIVTANEQILRPFNNSIIR